jgi:hypothetical protein
MTDWIDDIARFLRGIERFAIAQCRALTQVYRTLAEAATPQCKALWTFRRW